MVIEERFSVFSEFVKSEAERLGPGREGLLAAFPVSMQWLGLFFVGALLSLSKPPMGTAGATDTPKNISAGSRPFACQTIQENSCIGLAEHALNCNVARLCKRLLFRLG